MISIPLIQPNHVSRWTLVPAGPDNQDRTNTSLHYQVQVLKNILFAHLEFVVSLLVRHSVITLVIIVKVKSPYILKDTIHVDWN